jgi:hypothetical protein
MSSRGEKSVKRGVSRGGKRGEGEEEIEEWRFEKEEDMRWIAAYIRFRNMSRFSCRVGGM